jgi:trimeric autotransporter adhesin
MLDLRRSLDSRLNRFVRMISCLSTACLTLFVLMFASFAVGQNKIGTIAGAFSAPASPLAADIPGPTATVEDAQGNLYVASPFSQYVFEMSGNTVSAFAGKGFIGYWGPIGPATQRTLWGPSALAIDAHGNIYIADSGNNVVREVNTAGNIFTVAGTSDPCPQSTCGDGRKAINALLNNPQGVAVDTAGNVYIADTGDSRVRCVVMVARGCGGSFQPVGNIVAFAGSLTSCANPTSPCGDGGLAVNANLNSPAGVAVDSSGNVYVTDTGDNRIREVTNKVINTIAGTGKSCFGTSSCGDGGAALSANLGAPRATWVVSPTLYYIADTRTNRIRVVSSGTISTVAGNGAAGFSGDGGQPTSAKLSAPTGVFVDASGNMFISDTGNQRIREVTGIGSNPIINTVLGGGNGGDGGGATSPGVELAEPYAVAVDSSNNYYIADTANNRVRVVNTQSSNITVATVVIAPGAIATVAGTGQSGYPKGNNGIAAIKATLNAPRGVAVDSAGNIYLTASFDGVVWEVNNGTGIISQFAGNFQACTAPAPGCGDGGPAAKAQLTSPTSLAIDAAGNVFITDPGANRVREVSNGVISTAAGNGTAGYSGDGGLAINAKLSRPFGIAVDASENLYIADSANNVIRCVLGVVGGCGASTPRTCSGSTKDYAVGDIVTFAYDTNVNFQGDGGPAICATRWNPTELALDSRGNLFVGGGNDELVQRIDAAPPNVIATVAGIDTQWWWYSFTGDGGPATKAHINNSGLVIDNNEDLLIADIGNNRIREVAQLIGVGTPSPTSLNFGNVIVGQTSAPLPVTLQNTGSDDLVVSNISASGDFSQTNTCPSSSSSLVPSASCTISVVFTPKQKGVRTGFLTITDNGFKTKQTVKLTGTGE